MRLIRILLSGILFLFAGSTIAADNISIQIYETELNFHTSSGTLATLSHPDTGAILKASPDHASMISLAYPLKAFGPMRLESSLSDAGIRTDENSVHIHYKALKPTNPNVRMPAGHVSADISFREAGDGRSFIVKCSVANRSARPVRQILCPDLIGLLPIAGLDGTELRLGRDVAQPFQITWRKPRPDGQDDGPNAPMTMSGAGKDNWFHFPPGGYYVRNTLRWIDYGSLEGGLSIYERGWGYEDIRPHLWLHRSEKIPNQVRLAWEHRVTVNPGDTWESNEFWFTPHEGGWAKGIEPYRKYVRNVNPSRPIAKHIREGLGARIIWMQSELEADPPRPEFVYFTFKDLPEVARNSKAIGLSELILWVWHSGFEIPAKLLSALGTNSDLLQSHEQAKSMGVNLNFFVSYQVILNKHVEKYGLSPGTEDWTFHPEFIPTFRPYYDNRYTGQWVNPWHSRWRKDILAEFDRWIDMGFSSFCWDLWWQGNTESGSEPGILSLSKAIRNKARAEDPNSVFCGESLGRVANLENASPYLDYTWNWMSHIDAAPTINVLPVPRLNAVVDNPLEAKKAFAEGQYLFIMPGYPGKPNGSGKLKDFPELSDATRLLAERREQFLSFFTEGINVGESVLESKNNMFVRGYVLGRDQLLIIVLNDASRPQEVSLFLNVDLWLETAAKFTLTLFNENGVELRQIEDASAQGLARTHKLEPGEMAFLVLSRR